MFFKYILIKTPFSCLHLNISNAGTFINYFGQDSLYTKNKNNCPQEFYSLVIEGSLGTSLLRLLAIWNCNYFSKLITCQLLSALNVLFNHCNTLWENPQCTEKELETQGD